MGCRLLLMLPDKEYVWMCLRYSSCSRTPLSPVRMFLSHFHLFFVFTSPRESMKSFLPEYAHTHTHNITSSNGDVEAAYVRVLHYNLWKNVVHEVLWVMKLVSSFYLSHLSFHTGIRTHSIEITACFNIHRHAHTHTKNWLLYELNITRTFFFLSFFLETKGNSNKEKKRTKRENKEKKKISIQ